MRLVGMSIVAALTLGACDIPPEQQRRDVCTAFCECVVGSLPARLEECIVDDCFPELLPDVSDPCLECVYTSSQTCTTLFNDCSTLCLMPQPVP